MQKLLVYQSLWAMERRRPDGLEWPLQEKLEMIRAAGFDGAGVRFLEWSYDPDPTDTTAVTQYAFIVREADGAIDWFSETHVFGLFPRATWLHLLAQQGFDAEALTERTSEARTPRSMFLARRPAA